ncbi:MAG: hypothetical protein RL672_539, partial [Actinomycetota bacterium]
LFKVAPGLDKDALDATMNRVFERLAADETFAAAVDSMAVKVVPAS